MKKVTIQVEFPQNGNCRSGLLIEEAFKKQKIKLTKLRYTYVESKYGIAEMPPALILASLICDAVYLKTESTKMLIGFNWYPHQHLSGKYTFEFEK